jgi:hypothetical protein
MNDLSKAKPIDLALQTLIGREATTEEIAKFYQIRDLLGFAEHDSVWAMLLAFGHYEILYSDIAKNIAAQARETLADHKLSLEATAEAAERAVKGSLINTVNKVAQEAIAAGQKLAEADADKQARRKSMLTFAVAVGAAVVLSGSLAAFIAYTSYQAGKRSGLDAAGVDAVWAASGQGRAAKEFSALNPVQAMLDCQANFQTRKEANATYCIPYDEKSKLTSGWRIK